MPVVGVHFHRDIISSGAEKKLASVIFFIQLLFGILKLSFKFGATLAHGATLAQNSNCAFHCTYLWLPVFMNGLN